jgi:RNA polymerase sigma-70 factor, ECF subfamily
MMGTEVLVDTANTGLSDEEVVRRVINGERALFEILMRRYNQRLFRVTRSIVTNDLEAEDIIQDAYVRAYEHFCPRRTRNEFHSGRS